MGVILVTWLWRCLALPRPFHIGLSVTTAASHSKLRSKLPCAVNWLITSPKNVSSKGNVVYCCLPYNNVMLRSGLLGNYGFWFCSSSCRKSQGKVQN